MGKNEEEEKGEAQDVEHFWLGFFNEEGAADWLDAQQ